MSWNLSTYTPKNDGRPENLPRVESVNHDTLEASNPSSLTDAADGFS